MGLLLFDLCAVSLFLLITLSGLAGGGVTTGFRLLVLVIALAVAFGLRPFLTPYVGGVGWLAFFALAVPFFVICLGWGKLEARLVLKAERKIKKKYIYVLNTPLGFVFGLANAVLVLTAVWTSLIIVTPQMAEALSRSWSIRTVRLASTLPLNHLNATLDALQAGDWQVPMFTDLPEQKPAGQIIRLQDGTEIFLRSEEQDEDKPKTREEEIGELRETLRESGFTQGAEELERLQRATDTASFGSTKKSGTAKGEGTDKSAVEKLRNQRSKALDTFRNPE